MELILIHLDINTIQQEIMRLLEILMLEIFQNNDNEMKRNIKRRIDEDNEDNESNSCDEEKG